MKEDGRQIMEHLVDCVAVFGFYTESLGALETFVADPTSSFLIFPQLLIFNEQNHMFQ